MCGRAACVLDPSTYHERVSKAIGSNPKDTEWINKDAYKPSYNISPTSNLPIVHKKSVAGFYKSAYSLLSESSLVMDTVCWGVSDFNGKSTINNIRLETISTKFSRIMRNRCVIFVDGFYEWQKGPTHTSPKKINTPKQTYFICPKQDGIKKEHPKSQHELLCMAGLYETKQVDSNTRINCAVITGPSSGTMFDIHERIPCILSTPEQISKWLNGDDVDLLPNRQVTNEYLDFRKIGNHVNKAGNDNVNCILPQSETKGAIDKFFFKKETKKRRLEFDVVDVDTEQVKRIKVE
ncbi:hypothetical protein AKO1_015463 [Acrasis kona]|uniref:Embryonic stem cell-specific 5-hydroxymethylcytosine-binding protein n=1 Tax=Acrasis kona TaxID=1008807 RepID=A0AAW2ZG58_9EUKA